ncbi:MAG TPA: class II fumarate hydratase [Burkholderiaceae bacterium]|nr:class II fumarate hydratase [Burkholderiaceae bacterium]
MSDAKPTYRIEHDTFGDIEVASDKLWGAQTQRALHHFAISSERMPPELIWALALVKRAAALVNSELGVIDPAHAAAIAAAAGEVLAGEHGEQFPLSLWQSGSGTQTNMNLNEVLANRASELLGYQRGIDRAVHPNDEVNRGQSTNDVFPTAINVAVAKALAERLLPALDQLRRSLSQKAEEFDRFVKIGRTHLQDATPLTLGQEFSGYAAQLEFAQGAIKQGIESLMPLAIGGTAVGTGMATHPDFGRLVAAHIAAATGLPFVSAPNKFAALAASDALVFTHGSLKTLAAALLKIANDIRLLASGPRSGIGEIALPENEPGSSIMPGKVNPTQSEAMIMVCMQVFGHDVTINVAGSAGNFELNVCRPVLAHDALSSIRLLMDSITSFDRHCVAGIVARPERILELVDQSLMLVTALAPHIGYDKAAKIAQYAHREGTTLRAAAAALGHVSAEDFDRWVKPESMTGPTP